MSPRCALVSLIVTIGRRSFVTTVAGGLLVVAAVACASQPRTQAPAEPSRDGPNPAVASDPAVAPDPAVALLAPQPVAEGPCPYLPAAAVQDVNGERVGAVRVSGTATDRPHPACFFFTTSGATQLRTWIVVTTPRAARATLDSVVPVETSDLAELPGGWSGGSQPTPEGAVFAVIRQGTAVVVTTNQQQTISARRIAEQVIEALDL